MTTSYDFTGRSQARGGLDGTETWLERFVYQAVCVAAFSLRVLFAFLVAGLGIASLFGGAARLGLGLLVAAALIAPGKSTHLGDTLWWKLGIGLLLAAGLLTWHYSVNVEVLRARSHATQIARADAARAEAARRVAVERQEQAARAADEQEQRRAAEARARNEARSQASMSPQAPTGALSFVSSDRYANMDKLTTWSVMLGRATGCGMQVSGHFSRVGEWIDAVTPRGSGDQRLMLGIVMAGTQENARAQIEGRSPDSCATVRANFDGVGWP